MILNSWSIVSSVSALGTAIIAFCTITVTLIVNYRSQQEKHLAVQPWFHVTNTFNARGGPLLLTIVNDGNLNISIQKIELIYINGNSKQELDYKYKKGDSEAKVGRIIDIYIPWNSRLYGQPVQIKITYLNSYKKKMTAFSGKRLIVEELVEKRVLEFEDNENYFRPFTNTL